MKLLIILLLLPIISFSQKDKDTVRVIMLVCDTALTQPIKGDVWQIETYGQFDRKDHKIRFRFPPVYWMYGYIVNDLTIRIIEDWMPEPPPVYLDEKKKPLSKNIVVWQSKNIE